MQKCINEKVIRFISYAVLTIVETMLNKTHVIISVSKVLMYQQFSTS